MARRTNTFVIRPRSKQDTELLYDLLDASASLWNELTYERRQNFFDGESIWDTADYRKQYVGVLGSATAQQLIRKNKSAWKSFFSLKEKYDFGYTERLRLEVAGVPKWDGKQGRLELYDDKSSNQFRAFQPVTMDDSRLDTPLASEEVALDIGANNLVACTTTTGQQYLYEGRDGEITHRTRWFATSSNVSPTKAFRRCTSGS